MTVTVVTSENLAEFNAQQMGLSAPTEAAKVEPVVEKTSSSAEELENAETQDDQDDENEDKPKKANPKLEKRFSDLTKQREDARRDAERERAARTDLENRLKQYEDKEKPAVKQIDPDAKPKPDQFSDAFEYAESLAEWSAEKALRERDKLDSNRKQQDERNRLLSDWDQRQSAVKSEISDYADVIASSTVVVSDQVRDAILESEAGPQILYHLAKNPDLASELSTKSVISALREIGKLEAKLSGISSANEKPAAKPSRAPAPISPIRGSRSIETSLDSDGEFQGSYSAWKEARRSGRIK